MSYVIEWLHAKWKTIEKANEHSQQNFLPTRNQSVVISISGTNTYHLNTSNDYVTQLPLTHIAHISSNDIDGTMLFGALLHGNLCTSLAAALSRNHASQIAPS
jgi:hypothetical protein